MTRGWKAAGTAAIVIGSGLFAPPAGAAGPAAPQAGLKGEVAQRASEAEEAADTARDCTTSRRRLWVDGEGWIVRRVTACR